MCDQFVRDGSGSVHFLSTDVPGTRLRPILELSFNLRVTLSQQGRLSGFPETTDYPLALTSDSRARW